MSNGWSTVAAEKLAQDAAVERIAEIVRRMSEQVESLAPYVDELRARAMGLRDPMELRRSYDPLFPRPYRERLPCMTFHAASDPANDRKARAEAYAKGAG